MMKTLRELYQEHDGKVSDKWDIYLDEYPRIFEAYRKNPINLLEIGVQNGGSLDIWAKYFDNAINIVGCDINTDCSRLKYDDPRVSVIIGDAVSDKTESLIDKVSNDFDIVIDDGSHKSSDIVKTFSRYFKKVRQGGIFIAEDLHCSYWEELEGGLYDPYSSIQFFKRLADIINKEHWGVEKSERQYLRIFEDRYGISFNDSELSAIHSVEFVNSMCIVRKLPKKSNQLGPRVVVGNEFPVFSVIENLKGKYNKAPSQINNPLTSRDKDPIIEIEEQGRLLSELQKGIDARNEEIESLVFQINMLRNSTSWKITGPLRWGVGQLKILKKVGVKTRARQTFAHFVKFALVLLQGILRKHPKLKPKISKMLESTGMKRRLFHLYQNYGLVTHGKSDRLSSRASCDYRYWSECFDTPTEPEIEMLRRSSDPHTMVLVVGKFDESNIHNSIAVAKSLVDSVGQDWKAYFIFGGNVDEAAWTSKISEAVNEDLRFNFGGFPKIHNGPIILVDGGAELRSHALRIFSDCVQRTERHTIAYSDEDTKTAEGEIHSPWFKPQYSPIMAKQGQLLGKVVAFSSKLDILNDIQECILRGDCSLRDFVITLAEQAMEKDVVHIPHVLYRNLGQALEPLHLTAPDLQEIPNVSIIIPTRDRWDLLGPCLQSIKTSRWPSEKLQIIVVDNGSEDRKTIDNLALLERERTIKLLRDDLPFNWARLNNLAARNTKSEILIFINNDTEVNDADWIVKLASYALRPNVGAVGCKLLFPDRTVQHGGVIAGIQGVAGHGHLFIGEKDGGYCDLANITREVSAVTGACLAVERRKYEIVGGFNEDFPIAFNDVVFCFDLIKKGLSNIYLSDALMIHHESKSRGYDDTAEKVALNRRAAMRAWAIHPDIMRDDPYYSPNLSLYSPYGLSEAPRRKALWRSSVSEARPAKKVMLLSSTHAIGHGVPAVLSLQADYLVRSGFDVIVGGPKSENDFPYPGCERLEVYDALEAAAHAVWKRVDVIIPHTPPFFSVSRWVGNYPIVICYDHGEPPADWFRDAEYRKELLAEKDFSLTIAPFVYAISQAIAEESRTFVNGVIPEGNTHLGHWDQSAADRRQVVRKEKGWDDQFIVLDVCRFHHGERVYKGVDMYSSVFNQLLADNPELKGKVRFVLCGKGDPEDVRQMEAKGLTVFANVTNEEMFELYCAADSYMNFSRWEGFNLGIAQALAMGLPTLASNIPAHRAFGIPVTDSDVEASKWLIEQIDGNPDREPKLIDWEVSLEKWVELLSEVTN